MSDQGSFSEVERIQCLSSEYVSVDAGRQRRGLRPINGVLILACKKALRGDEWSLGWVREILAKNDAAAQDVVAILKGRYGK